MSTTLRRLTSGPWLPAHQSNSAYAWLSMLVFFFWKYFSLSVSPLEIVLAVLTTVVFLVLYLTSFWVSGKAGYAIIAGIALLGLSWAGTNPGSSVFIVFAATTCAIIRQLKYAYASLALIIAAVLAEVIWLDLPADFWAPGFVVSSAIGVASIMQSTLRRSQSKLLRSQEEAAHLATIAERERISRDLHDLLGHTLSMITIKAELAGKLLSRDVDACRKEISDIEQTARNALGEVRAAVTGYRQVGLTHELANAAGSLAAAQIGLTSSVDAMQLSAAQENVLSLALREAVTNVLRHSGARHCAITLTNLPSGVRLTIQDDGRQVPDRQAIRDGNGLTGMRERTEALGGRVSIDVSNGMCLRIDVPHQSNREQPCQQ